MRFSAYVALGLAALVTACSPAKPAKAPAAGRTAVRFQTDWRAQAEQGGFYQALASGDRPRWKAAAAKLSASGNSSDGLSASARWYSCRAAT